MYFCGVDLCHLMPNHIHGVIALGNTMMDAVGATLAVARNDARTDIVININNGQTTQKLPKN